MLEPLGPFSLGAVARFWGGFTPATHGGLDAEGHLHMAFPVEGSWQTAGVCVREADGQIVGQVYGDVNLEAARQQTARVLSIDVDGRGFPDIAERDPIVADLLRRYPGLRPVCFYAPYEAATWAILSHRVRMSQAARLKTNMREALGEVVEIHGDRLRAFPPPGVLAGLEEFPSVPAQKIVKLRAIAVAALEGRLDAALLRSLPAEEALARLQELPGIGPFSAELILLRGAGDPDYLTLTEPRFRRAVARAYQLDEVPSDDDLRRISERWRPFRTWVTFLLRQDLDELVPD